MRMSRVPFRTLREVPSGVESPGYGLLLRARFVRSVRPGCHAWLPWGLATLRRLESRARRDLSGLGGVEVHLPDLREAGHPWGQLAELALAETRSYRQLPVVLCTVADWTREKPSSQRGGTGPIAFSGAWLFSAHATAEDRDEFLGTLRVTWGELLAGLGLEACWAVAPSTRGGSASARIAVVEQPAGEVELALCSHCGYRAERSVASAAWPEPPDEPFLEPELVATPGASTIDELAAFLHLPTSKTMKVVFYTVDSQVVCVALRGDLMVDEKKVARALGTPDLYGSTEHELRKVGAVGGYGSPVGLKGALVWVDPSVMKARNLVAGANQEGFHLLHVNAERDFQPDRIADVARVREGDPCPGCGKGLELARGVELARVRALEPGPAREMGRGYLSAQGEEVPLELGEGCLLLDPVIGVVAGQNRDEDGLIWPTSLAPFDVYIVVLKGKGPEVPEQAERLYAAFTEQGWAVLLDDRDDRAGVKFKDADLLGVPIRVTVSGRSLAAGGAEVKLRWEKDVELVDLDRLLGFLSELLGREGRAGNLT